MLKLKQYVMEDIDEESGEISLKFSGPEFQLEHSLLSVSEWESKYKKPFLSDKEKNMFSVAYKSITSNQRNSIRVLQMALKKPDVADNKEICDEITTFMETLKGELKNKCDDVVALCNRLLENPDLSPEDFVFYYKMIGG